MMGDRLVKFTGQVEDLGVDLDDIAPSIPTERGRAAWVIERVRQSIQHIADTHGHLVEEVAVQAAPEDLPGDLEAQWPWPDVPVRLTAEDDGQLTPVPAGLFRLWLTVAENPELRSEDEKAKGFRLADLAHTHGIVPSEGQEDQIRALGDLTALWEATDPASLAEALATVQRGTDS